MGSNDKFYSLLRTLCEMVGFDSNTGEGILSFLSVILDGIGCPPAPATWDNISLHYRNADMENTAFLFSLWRNPHSKYLLPFRNICVTEDDMRWMRLLTRTRRALKYRNQLLPRAIEPFFATIVLAHKVLCMVGAPPDANTNITLNLSKRLRAIVTPNAIFFLDGVSDDG